jgi:hypothetical protein
MQPTYRPPRDRDAYATIRGYVYQVDRAVDRWLLLDDGACLELERGEDIDLDTLGAALASGDPNQQARLLEQIKHREKNLTLRDPSAIEALANAVEHLRENQGLSLRFCYTTNAVIGREKLSPFPGGMPGVQLWEQIRCGQLPGPEVPAALRSLRRFFRSQSQPDAVPDGVWSAFKDFLKESNSATFADLVSRFEWSTAQTPAADYPSRLCDDLIDLALAANLEEAQALYGRLFLYVLRLLCQPGIKRLTRAELHALASAPALPAVDRAILTLLRERLEHTDSRVELVESAVSAMSKDIRLLAQQAHVLERFEVTVPVPDVELPPLVQRLCRRRQTVGRLLEAIADRHWVAVCGGADMGKTQLALLAAQCDWPTRGWVRFNHSMHIDAACSLLDAAAARLLDCGVLRPGALVILDDLPRLGGDEPLSQRLGLLVQRLGEAGCKLLTTSQHNLPARLRHELGGAVAEFTVPPFDDAEAAEVFAAHGAPAGTPPANAVRFVNRLARGHPLLLALAAEFLCGRNWELREEEFDALLRGEYAEQAHEQTLSRLANRLGEPQRELLFRLTLAIGSFTGEEVTSLAGVAPEVTQPLVRLSDLLGAWIQRESDSRMVVSPLVSGLGEGNLSAATRLSCHRVLADLIVHRGMNQFQAQIAITHNLRAEEFDRALILYLILLEKSKRHPQAPGIDSVLGMWADTPLPERVSVGMQLCVRGYQLDAFARHGRSIDFLLRDVDALMARAQEADSWGVASVTVFATIHAAAQHPDRVLGYVDRLLSFETVRHVDGSELRFQRGLALDNLLWFLVPRLDSPGRLAAWQATVDRLPLGRLKRLFRSRMGRQGVLVLADAMTLQEMAKPKEARDWQPIIRAVNELEAWGRDRGLRQVQMAAIRSLVILYGDPIRQIDQIATRALAALDEMRDMPEATFFLAGTLGRQYILAGRLAQARPLLERALSQKVEGHDWERMLYLLAASQAEGESDADAGLRHATAAVNVARESREILPIEVARGFAELGLARFLTVGGKAGALLAWPDWLEAAERLLRAEADDDAWRDLSVIFAHTTSYLTDLAANGQPPAKSRDGSEFTALRRGWFLITVSGRAALYFGGAKAGLCWLMARYAEAAGAKEESLRWLSRAAEATEEVPGSYLQAGIGMEMIPMLVAADRYEAAVQAGVQGARSMVAVLSGERGDFQRLVQPGRDQSAEAAALSDAQARRAEHFARIAALVPAMVRVARRALEDSPGAFAAGQKVASLCHQFSAVARVPELWMAAGEVFSEVCRDGVSDRQLVERGTGFDAQESPELRVLAYVGAAIHADPFQAFCSQVASAPCLLRWYPGDSLTYRVILLPYLEDYWRRVLDHGRFHFNAPGLVVEPMRAALEGPEDRRARAILLAVRQGFFRIPSNLHEAIQWLSST